MKKGSKTKTLFNIEIILSITFGIYIILDWYNPSMGFLENRLFKVLLLAFCFISLASGIIYNEHLLKDEEEASKNKKSKQKTKENKKEESAED